MPVQHAVFHRYLPTPAAAKLLHRSVSWLLRQKDIPYLPGRPNLYSVDDLHTWFERNKAQPDDLNMGVYKREYGDKKTGKPVCITSSVTANSAIGNLVS